MNNPLVSIIVPAYNVALYIERALTSLLAQTYSHFELLVVDDGSSDGTGEILDELAARDERITVFHTPNQGAPAARNLALDAAKGTYVHFFDADDWAEPTMLEEEVTFAQKYNLELVVSGFTIETYYAYDEYLSEKKATSTCVFPTQQAFRNQAYELFDQNLLYVPWNKLFLRSLIETKHIRFQNTFWDDFPFVLDYIKDVERVGVLSNTFYHFQRMRPESETARWRPQMYEKREEEHGWLEELFVYWNIEHDAATQEMLYRRYIERLVGCIENVCNPACKLTAREKKEAIWHMISSPRVQKALKLARPHSLWMKLMLIPIRIKSTTLTLAEGCFISWVKRKNTKIFATLKAKR